MSSKLQLPAVPRNKPWPGKRRRTRNGLPGPRQALSPAFLPVSLPSSRAAKLTARAARVGFDWPDAPAVLSKLDEEVAEVRAELSDADPDRLADEVGDLLFVVANLARKLDLDPEACLRQANRKFERRFSGMEQQVASAGNTLADISLEEMELIWQKVKYHQRITG